MKIWHLAVVAGSLLAPRSLFSQQRFDPPTATVPLAVTYCHPADSNAPAFSVSYVDLRAVGTDSLPEIQAHEAVHDRMNRDSLAVGRCPGPRGDVLASLEREIGAYCASDSVRVKRTHDIPEAGQVTVSRLIDQFGDRVTRKGIIARFRERCPAFSWGVVLW